MRKDNEDVLKVFIYDWNRFVNFTFKTLSFLVPTKPTNEILGTFVCRIDVSAGDISDQISGIVKISEVGLPAYITLPNIIRYKKEVNDDTHAMYKIRLH